MKVTKYFIEGQLAARKGCINVCRYRKPENIAEFSKGWESVDRSYCVMSRGVGVPSFHEYGTRAECEARSITLAVLDRARRYYVVDAATGEEVIYKAFNE